MSHSKKHRKKVMKTQLNQEQFANFVGYVWNNSYWAEKFQGNIWAVIAESEANRSFNDGWGYCKSKLEMCTENGLSWVYETTSGTIFNVTQSRWTNEEGKVDPPTFIVEIPEHRAKSGRTHYDYLQAVLAGIPFLSWGEYFYGTDATALKVHTYWCGGDIEKVLEARTSELKRQLGIRVREKAIETNSDDATYEDYEDYEEELLEEKL